MEYSLIKLLEDEINAGKKLLQQLTKELRRLPEGHLELSVAKGKYLYPYAVSTKDGKTIRRYIPKKNLRLASQLAQKAYDLRMKKTILKRGKALERALLALRDFDPSAVYDCESPERKKLIIPHIPTDEQFIEQWYEEHHGAQNSFPMATSYTTISGETVRSKSEKMIADTYYLAGVPYIYEPSIILANGRTRNPDFAVMNVRTRKTMYHEHFGMMDDDEYRQHAILKMREYNRSGFRTGDTMLYTYEGEGIPFDQEELDELIRAFLM